MTDFLFALLLVAGILLALAIATAVYLIAWGSRRWKLVEAWQRGHDAGMSDARGPFADEYTHNPYLADHEVAHRG